MTTMLKFGNSLATHGTDRTWQRDARYGPLPNRQNASGSGKSPGLVRGLGDGESGGFTRCVRENETPSRAQHSQLHSGPAKTEHRKLVNPCGRCIRAIARGKKRMKLRTVRVRLGDRADAGAACASLAAEGQEMGRRTEDTEDSGQTGRRADGQRLFAISISFFLCPTMSRLRQLQCLRPHRIRSIRASACNPLGRQPAAIRIGFLLASKHWAMVSGCER